MAADPKVESVEATGRTTPLTHGIGVTGLRAFSGVIREEFLSTLTGRRGSLIFEEMASNDSTCAALIFAIRNSIRAMEWRVDPADPDDPKAVEAAELLEQMLFRDMAQTWPEFIESVCSMFVYGFSVHEIIWKKRNGPNSIEWLSSVASDGLYGIESLSPRSQKTIECWIFDGEDHVVGFTQMPYDRPQVEVPLSRCLHFTTRFELGNPEGYSLLRGAYRSWYWCKRLEEIEGIGVERDLAGYPVLYVPGDMLDPNATAPMIAARQTYETMLSKIRRDQNEGLLLPSDRDESGNRHYEFSLMSSGGARQNNIDASIGRYQRNIARSVLADFIFLGAEGGGSLALGQEKVSVFVTSLQGYANSISAEINRSLVAKIWSINGLAEELMPTLSPGELKTPDLAATASYIKALSDVGYNLSADADLDAHLRRIADFPPPPIDDGEYDAPEGAEEEVAAPVDEMEKRVTKALQERAARRPTLAGAEAILAKRRKEIARG